MDLKPKVTAKKSEFISNYVYVYVYVNGIISDFELSKLCTEPIESERTNVQFSLILLQKPVKEFPIYLGISNWGFSEDAVWKKRKVVCP